MTEQNSVSMDSSFNSLPVASHWYGQAEEALPKQKSNKSASIALTQCHVQESNREEDNSHPDAIHTSINTEVMGQFPNRFYPQTHAEVLADEWQRIERLKEDFLSTVSHELKTPLSSMYLSIQLLELLLVESGEMLSSPGQSPPMTAGHPIQDKAAWVENPLSQEDMSWAHQIQKKRDKIRQCLKSLSSECKKEITLVNNLLSLQDSRANLPSPALACIFLHDWLRDVLAPFYRQFKHKRHSFSYDIGSSLSYIITDCIRLEKILQELITNACKFTPDDGHIFLSIWEHNNGLMMTVVNKGDRIPSDEIPNLFNIFYRIPRSDPWQTKGTGIGLALVKKWAEAIGGEIRVDTGTFGNAFTLYLPSDHQMKQVKV